MSGMTRLFLPFLLICCFFLFDESRSQAAEKQAIIHGTRQVNLRAGPSVDRPPTTILQEGDRLAAAPQDLASPSVAQPGEQKSPPTKSPSLIQMLEGRETDMLLWLAIAAAFFLIGWICGGNYYLRRDRLRRTKLRF